MGITYVIDGAKIICSQGIGESTLNKTCDNHVKIHDQIVLTVAENKPYINIQPFSFCKSPLNPAVVAAGMEPATCNPVICTKWMKARTDVFLSGELILNSDCQLGCMYNGKIEILDDGQRKL